MDHTEMRENTRGIIRGIGVDTVKISDVRRLLEMKEFPDVFLNYTFTAAEIAACPERDDPAEFFSTRFAAKEAVFKAVAHLTPEKTFDFRIVETLRNRDGSPFVNITEELAAILKKADAGSLLISMTTEGDYATAFVIAGNF